MDYGVAMTTYRIGFVGTGPDPENPEWGTSAAMAYRHATAYNDRDDCTLVGCADLVQEHAAVFADRFDISEAGVYEDYETMLVEVEPDVVSVCTPVPTHAPIVIDLAESGVPSAIHCEKPMADTWGDCKRMIAACEHNDAQLTFNHQRRFSGAYREAKRLAEAGEIGTVRRFEIGGKNLFDFGSHLIDICNGILGEQSVAWALSQIDYRNEDLRYGSHNENQAFALWEYDDGTHAVLSTGYGSQLVDSYVRVIGTKGKIELWPESVDASLRVRIQGQTEFREPRCQTPYESMLHGAINDVLTGLSSDARPELAAAHVRTANEIIFACWESVRRRGRVELPLSIEDNPLRAMVEAGVITPE